MTDDRPTLRRDTAPLALLLIIGTVVFADLFVAGSHLFVRDLTRYYWPTKRIVREVIQGGEFPYWNRYYSAGQPMAANPEYEVFYPPQWLILLPDYELGYKLHIVVHFWILLAGAWFAFRGSGMGRGASWIGAFSLGMGGAFLSLVNLLPILFAAAWIPLIWLFVRRYLSSGSGLDFSLAAIFVGLQTLAGEPTTMLQTWFLMGVHALWHGWNHGTLRGILTAVVRVGLALGAGLVVGAAQFVPALVHVGESARSMAFPFSLVTAWSMPWARPLELLFPNLFGHLYRPGLGAVYWGGGMYGRMASPFLFSIYPGLLVTVLAFAALASRLRGWLVSTGIVAFASLIALGSHTPLFRWLYDLGVAQSIRYPEKFFLMAVLMVTLAGATALDRILQGDRRLLKVALGIAAAVLVATIPLSIATLLPAYPRWFDAVFGVAKSSRFAAMLELSSAGWYFALLRALAVTVLLFVASRAVARGRLPGRRWIAAAVVFCVVDLMPLAPELNPTMPASFMTPPPVVAELDPQRSSYRIFHEVDWYGSSDTARRYFGTGDAVYWIVRNGMFPMTPATWGFRSVLERDYDKTLLLPTIDLVDAMWAVRDGGQKRWAEIFMAMSNARYRAAYVPYAEEKERIGGRMKQAQPIRFSEVQGNDRYYFADQIVTIDGKEDFIELLKEGEWAGRPAFGSLQSFEPADGRVLRVTESANSATVEVEASGRTLLVIANTPHRYWTAWLNGRTVAIETVNLAYQAVEIPAGRHRLELKYRSPVVDASLGLSIAGLLLVGGIGLWPRRRRRGSKGAEAPADTDDVDQHSTRVADDVDSRAG